MYSPRSPLHVEATNPNRDNGVFEISDLKFEISELPLRELEAFARALLSVLLALFDARVARNQSGVL